MNTEAPVSTLLWKENELLLLILDNFLNVHRDHKQISCQSVSLYANTVGRSYMVPADGSILV